jgi:hypothetical protein
VIADSNAESCRSGMHTYTEWSARAKLTRHRLRGEEQFTFHCPWGDHWHCTDRPLEELLSDGAD